MIFIDDEQFIEREQHEPFLDEVQDEYGDRLPFVDEAAL